MARPKKITSAENGKLGGRPKGSKSATTIMKEMELEEFQKLARERMEALFYSQLSLALGVQHLIRIDETQKGGRDHTIVTEQHELMDVLAQMHQGDNGAGVYNDKYYYITTKAPDNFALNSILDRAYGRAQQRIDHTTKNKELPQPIMHVVQDNDGN